MDERLAAVVVVALCVLALGLGAGGLERSPWGNVSESDDRAGAGEGLEQPETGLGPVDGSEVGAEGPILPTDIILALMLVLIVLGIPGLIRIGKYRVAGMVLAFLVTLVLFWAVVEYFGGVGLDPSGGSGSGNVTETPTNGSSGPISSPGVNVTTLLLYGVVGAALALAVGLVFRSSGSVELTGDEQETAAPTDEPEDPEAVAAAAGRAADYIERGPDLSNAVYRAWSEMTDALDVREAETSTPGEFAAAAVAAGMDRDDVGELTRLFEEVRYGDAEPSTEREQRAIDALRRIEGSYAAEFDVDDAGESE